MNEQALRTALGVEESWATLTDRQRETVRAFIRLRTIAATARDLGVNRHAVRKNLHYAGKKFLAFAAEISRG